MDRLSKLVTGASLFFLASISYAGYAQLSPPSFWSPTPVGGSVGTFNVGAAANAATISNGTVRTNAALNVGGRAVQVPVSMRLAANAPKIAAAAIYLNPYLRAASAIAGWIAAAGIVYSLVSNQWEIPFDGKESDGFYWTAGSGKFLTYQQAADDLLIRLNSSYDPKQNYFVNSGCSHASIDKVVCDFSFFVYGGFSHINKYNINRLSESGCPAGWYVTPAGCIQNPQPQRVSEDEFVDKVKKNPMPDKVPQEIPAPLPVEIPKINPNPEPLPFFVPTGDPVPNPSFDPSKAPSPQNVPKIQPGTRVKPANDPVEPWRVDVAPVDKPVLDPNAAPDRNPDFGSKPNGETPSKNPEQSDLCDKHPDVLACATSGDNQDEPIKEKKIDIDLSPDSGWGASSSACPAPKVINPQGRQILIPYDLFCTYSQGMRPIILAMAWLSAAFILLGFKES